MYLLENPKALSAISVDTPDHIEEFLVHEDFVDKWKFTGNTRILTDRQFNTISSNKTPQGVIGVIRLPADTYSESLPEECGNRILLLEDIQDPGNVGTLIRTAAAFDFSGVLLSKECADPFSPKTIQAAAGSITGVWIRVSEGIHEIAAKLKKRSYSIIAADTRGGADIACSSGDNIVLALGNEGKGLSKKMLDLADSVFTIPITGSSVESLNVAVAGSIGMYLLSQKSKV